MFKLFRWYDYVILGVIFFYLFIFSSNLPLFYDEAYNLQVPLMLLKEQKYDTIYHFRTFDSITTISTGPTVLVPVFIVFKWFGVGVLRARIVQYVYVIALVGLFWGLSVKHFNRVIGLALLLILYSIPQLNIMLSVLGELPAIFFVVLGLMFWRGSTERNQNLAILVMGLSVITKLYFLLVLFPLLVFIAVRAFQTKQPIRSYVQEAIITSAIFLFPFVLGELVKFILLGYESYMKYLVELVHFVDDQQIDISKVLIAQFPVTPSDKFNAFATGLFPGVPIWMTGLLVGAVTITSLQRMVQGIGGENLIFSLAFMIFATYFVWFLFLDSSPWWRHISPFSILFLFLLGDLIHKSVKVSESLPVKYGLILGLSALFVAFVIPFVVQQHKNIQTYSNRLQTQKEFAEVVTSYLNQGYQIGVDGWWQAPEIAFLTGGARFKPFNCEKEHPEKYLVIYTGLEEALAPDQANAFKACLGEKVFENSDQTFVLYEPTR